MKTLKPLVGPSASKPSKKDPTFYAGVPHPFLFAIVALLDSVMKGESTDIAKDLGEAKRLVEAPAVFVGVGTQIRERATGELVPFVRDGKPALRADSVILYTQDPTRERSSDEKAGALIRTFGQQAGFVRSHPYFEALEAQYREEIGAEQPKGATQIPAGSAKAVPAGEEEVTAR